MVDTKYYTKLLFNEETGKERYSLAQKEAEKIYTKNDTEYCWNFAMECYNCELYYIQFLGVYILGLIGNQKALYFLKNTVSKNPAWQVQEFLAMAFDNYCKKNGYENSLETINEWLSDKNANIRRAVTEGLRIWTKRPYFKDNPEETVKLLSSHKADESEYVRKSVGNSLKDISKAYPELVRKELNEWKLDTKEIIQVYKLANKKIENE
jgi:3-methyladenine DNA glycosylase AlkC